MTIFDPTKPVRTRCGYPARILCTDFKGSAAHPILAAVTEADGAEHAYGYRFDGRFLVGEEHDLDLVNVETPKIIPANRLTAGQLGRVVEGFCSGHMVLRTFEHVVDITDSSIEWHEEDAECVMVEPLPNARLQVVTEEEG